ncbi:MAG: acyl dehydratase [Acidimicrobiia bacterium]|nr:acyl dehydratase [Acidimicrobiia bacterium]
MTTPEPRDRTFDDYTVGETFEFGYLDVTAAEIVEFGRKYDPQPFHVDAEAAKTSIFGGLIASGWHTGAMAMRLYVDNVLSPEHSLGSPGVDELRFLAPVRPGARLALRVTVLDLVPSRSKPDRGVVRQRLEVLDAAADPPVLVASMATMGLFRRRGA